MKRGLSIVIFLMGLCIGANAIAQQKFKVKHFSTEDGLSHEKITCITKDKYGFMWFGTWDGMNRFDGHEFLNFKSYPGDKSNLKNNRIDNIVEGKDGYLWVRSDDKLIYRFDKRSGEFIEISKLIKNKLIIKSGFNRIIVSKNGQVWLLSKNQGIIEITNSGYSAITYAKNRSRNYHLPSNKLNFFTEDSEHHIWVGTDHGLGLLSPDRAQVYHSTPIPSEFGSGHDYTSMSEDHTYVVFSTKDGYLIIYNKLTRRFMGKKLFATQALNSVCVSSKKDFIYCATSSGDLQIINKSNLELQSTVKADANAVYSIYEDKSGLLWIEPTANGIIKYDPVTGKLKHFTQKVYSDYPNGSEYFRIFEDNKGHVWANMKGGGFGYYNATKDVIDPFFNDPVSQDYRFSNKVNFEYYDPAGILWLSTEDRGVEKITIQENDFHLQALVEHSFIKSDNEVRAVYQDHEHRLWVASKRKLHTFQNGKEISGLFVNKPYNIISQIYSIVEDHNGVIWFGTKGDGLYKAEPVGNKRDKYQLTHYESDDNDINSLSSHTIYTILEDRQNRIWIGTYGGGLNQAVTKNHQTTFNSFKNRFKNYPKTLYHKIRHLELDTRGDLWIGTTDGLLVLDPALGGSGNFRYTRYNKIPGDKQSLGNNDIQFIYRDSDKRMWLGTSGGGLNLAIGNDPFKSLKFRPFTIQDGLANDFVLSMVEDNNRNLWIATQRGLSEFNFTGNTFKNFNSYDGLPQSGFSEGTCLKLSSGDLVFGAVPGYLSFDPSRITNRKINANMALTNLQVNGKDAGIYQNQFPVLKSDIYYTSAVTLKYNQNTISIDFGVLDFRSANKQADTYRLKGLDTSWNKNAVNHRRVTYSNLAPGAYLFQVKSSDKDLYLNTPLRSLSITILPPPWRTWWAYLIYMILACIGLEMARRVVVTVLKLRQRIAVDQRLTDLKLNFFTNISHELRTPLSLILNPAEAILQKEDLSPRGKEYASIIMKNANRMVRFINQLLDLRKVQSGKAVLHLTQIEVIAFIKNIGTYFTELSHEKQVSLQIVSDLSELFVWVDAEKFDIVIYNLLANAFKFTDVGSQISVMINRDDHQGCFKIEIIDQGIGVPKDKLKDIFELYYEGEHKCGQNLKGTGIGLALSKELIELHHGTISATNNLDRGLKITLQMQLGRAHYSDGDVIFHDNVQEQKFAHSVDKHIPFSLLTEERNDPDMPLVLLIEDNNDLRNFLTVQLSEYYRVVSAVDGKEGWEKAIALVPNLILSDIMMPKMNGIQLLDKVKNNPETSHIPFILLSAKSSVENQIEGLKYGADYYIAKPFDNSLLITAIDNLIKQRRRIFDSILNGKTRGDISASEITITSRDESFLRRAIDIVEKGMSDSEFNIDCVTGLMGMSRSSFYKKLKSLTDLSPVEFLKEMRLTRGKKLLDAGEDNISQVAYAVGFTDPKYFGCCFKKQFNVLPSEYIKNLREHAEAL